MLIAVWFYHCSEISVARVDLVGPGVPSSPTDSLVCCLRTACRLWTPFAGMMVRTGLIVVVVPMMAVMAVSPFFQQSAVVVFVVVAVALPRAA